MELRSEKWLEMKDEAIYKTITKVQNEVLVRLKCRHPVIMPD
jgi:hypothetical protein